MTAQEELKRQAAWRAVEAVKSGMVLGLGTGSTVRYAIDRLGELQQSGKLRDIVGIPTSEKTTEQARGLGLSLATLKEHARVDLAIDGADEVDPRCDLIKGLGGALVREKQVEQVAARFIVIVDESKLVAKLGTKAPLPVEVWPNRWRHVAIRLRAFGCTPVLRGGEEQPFVSDNGNNIIDCRFAAGIEEAARLAGWIDALPDVAGHGLFLGMASEVVVAAPGGIRVIKPER